MSELARRDAAPLSLDERLRKAEVLAKASALPKAYRENPPNVLVAIDYAIGLGIKPELALHNIDVIDGSPEPNAYAIGGLVRKAGHRMRSWGDEKSATVQIWRKDDPEFMYEATWTIEMAKHAGLLAKDNWAKYPADMLMNRAMKQCARRACSEVYLGTLETPTLAEWPETITTVTVTRDIPGNSAQTGTGVPVTPVPVTVDTDTGEIPAAHPQQIQEIRALAPQSWTSEQLLQYVARVIGHQLAKPTDLTAEEADQVLDALTQHTEETDQ